jgi:mannose-6-phosphate isomerase-like protein (cupin superfamily)
MSKKPEVKNFNNPDEVREIPYGKLEIINVGGKFAGKTTFQPGWKWSESVKPLAKTHSCEFNHLLYVISGTMRVKMDNGTELDCKAGDICNIPPGHDAWVIGNEQVISIDFDENANYAKPAN